MSPWKILQWVFVPNFFGVTIYGNNTLQKGASLKLGWIPKLMLLQSFSPFKDSSIVALVTHGTMLFPVSIDILEILKIKHFLFIFDLKMIIFPLEQISSKYLLPSVSSNRYLAKFLSATFNWSYSYWQFPARGSSIVQCVRNKFVQKYELAALEYCSEYIKWQLYYVNTKTTHLFSKVS